MDCLHPWKITQNKILMPISQRMCSLVKMFENMGKQAEPNNNGNAIEKSEESHQEGRCNMGEKKSDNEVKWQQVKGNMPQLTVI